MRRETTKNEVTRKQKKNEGKLLRKQKREERRRKLRCEKIQLCRFTRNRKPSAQDFQKSYSISEVHQIKIHLARRRQFRRVL